jgi:aminoglycoside phosphotransferase (APT) family kinase protein
LSAPFADQLQKLLQVAVARHVGAPGTVHDLTRLSGGATKTTWAFAADIGEHREPFILQTTDVGTSPVPDPLAGVTPRLTAEEDARVMMAAAACGAPAPKVRAVLEPADGLGRGYITDRVEGETLAPRILRDERFAAARAVLAAQCGEILAAIHRVDIAPLSFLKSQGAAAQLAAYRRVVDHYGHRLPALELGFRWIAERLPARSRHTLVHGDFRLGNLIVGEKGLACVLDWEIAQTGDPMQDLGWICCRTWRFGGERPVGGFGRREDLFAAYERASGHAVDPDHVRFWEAFGNLKWAVICLRKGLRWRDGTEPISLEQSAIGRRIEEPLWDLLNLIEGLD